VVHIFRAAHGSVADAISTPCCSAIPSFTDMEINGNRELTAMPGYNELGHPRAVGTEREETRWNR
jgi:hypothetical protein